MRQILGLVMLLLSMGCAVVDSSSVDQKEIYSHYAVHYDPEEGVLRFTASFTVGKGIGTAVALKDPSLVALDGMTLREERDIFGQVIYVHEIAHPSSSDLSRAYTFRYVNHEGESHENFVSFLRAARVESSPTLPLRDGARVSWFADGGLTSSEELAITLRSTESGRESASVSVYGSKPASGTAYFTADSLHRVGPGYARLSLCRSRTASANGNAIGGAIRMRRCTSPSYVNVVP